MSESMTIGAGTLLPDRLGAGGPRLVAVMKRDCPVCEMTRPVLGRAVEAGVPTLLVSQDDHRIAMEFASSLAGVDLLVDEDLGLSEELHLDTVPTFIGVAADGSVAWSLQGWDSDAFSAAFSQPWAEATHPGARDPVDVSDLAPFRPGCASKNRDPDVIERRRWAEAGRKLAARRFELPEAADVQEYFASRGLTDGLPITPPTPERVARMLGGTGRASDEVVAEVPPSLIACTVEKVAINAVMAGCEPGHLPLILGAVEAACTSEFNLHGLICTTHSAGPVVIVNGPVRQDVGLNAGDNVLGQGHRSNATIGRALQLVARNVGGGRPGEIDKAVFGNPGKVGFCFAEDEEHTDWEPLHVRRGLDASSSAVTLFPGEAPRVVVDQMSRDPESLTRSIAAGLRGVAHYKMGYVLPIRDDVFVPTFDAVVVVGPLHRRIFEGAGWSATDVQEAVFEATRTPLWELRHGHGGCAEGYDPEWLRDGTPDDMDVFKFSAPESILVVAAGGDGALMSAIIGGWASGAAGSTTVTREVRR